MLVLTRKVGEKINIGDDIVVSVVEIGKGFIKLGLEAPKQVPIFRHEVFLNMQTENLESSRKTATDINLAARLLIDKGMKE